MENKEKTKQWWRWLLFIPAGVLVAIVGIPIGVLINKLSTLGFLGFANGILYKCTQIIVEVGLMYTSAVVAAYVAPNEKIGGIIYSSLMLAFLIVSAVLGILVGSFTKERWSLTVIMAGSILAMIIAIKRAADDDLIGS